MREIFCVKYFLFISMFLTGLITCSLLTPCHRLSSPIYSPSHSLCSASHLNFIMLWVAWHGTMQRNETVPVGIMSIILSMKKDVSRYVTCLNALCRLNKHVLNRNHRKLIMIGELLSWCFGHRAHDVEAAL